MVLRFGFYHEAHGAMFSNAYHGSFAASPSSLLRPHLQIYLLATNRQPNQTTATKSPTMPPKGGGKKEPEKKVEKKVEKKEGERQL